MHYDASFDANLSCTATPYLKGEKKKRRRKGREGRRNKNNTLSQMLSLEATEAIVGLLVSLDRLVPSWRLEKGSLLCASASATLPASAASVMLALGGMLAEL